MPLVFGRGAISCVLSTSSLFASRIFRAKTLDDETNAADTQEMTQQHPLAAAVQPLIDEWLASDAGILATYERELADLRIAS